MLMFDVKIYVICIFKKNCNLKIFNFKQQKLPRGVIFLVDPFKFI
jgi:hypothetical protein